MAGPYEPASVDENGESESRPGFFRDRRKLIILSAVLVAILVLIIILSVSLSTGGSAEPDAIEAGTDPDTSQNLTWWRNESIYSVYIESFFDTDDDGYGDIRGLATKLPYIKDLGFTVVWISLILNQDSGYVQHDVRNFTQTNWRRSETSDLSSFQFLANKAHELGMKLIMDFEVNQSGTQHLWFFDSTDLKESYKDFYIWRNGTGAGPPNNWLSVRGGSAWKYNNRRKQYHLQQLHQGTADLNYRNPEVLKKIKEAIGFWLEKGADGVHLTNTAFLMEDPSFLDEEVLSGTDPSNYSNLNHTMTKNRPESYTKVVTPIKESVESRMKDQVVAITIDSSMNDKQIAIGSADLTFDSRIVERVSKDSTCQDLRQLLTEIRDSYEKSWPTWLLGTWDSKRLKTRLGSLSEAFQVVTFLLRGTPVMYYGDEIGMEDVSISFDDARDPFAREGGNATYNEESSRDPHRTPMQWNEQKNAGFTNATKLFLPVSKNYTELNVEKQAADARSNLNRVKRLNKLRQQHLTSRMSNITCNNDIMFFERHSKDGGLVVLVNFGNRQNFNLNSVTSKGPFEIALTTSLDRNQQNGTIVTGTMDVFTKEGLVLRYGKN